MDNFFGIIFLDYKNIIVIYAYDMKVCKELNFMNFKTFVIGMVICCLLSFVLGLERQVRRRFIGLRTMILVAVGSYIFVSFTFLVDGYQVDASRIAAQVVAGIGFLGAGVIIKDNKSVKETGKFL